MELFNGRPEDFARRLPKEQRVYELLDSLGIEYQRIDHEAAMTMEACAAIDEVLDATICKNLLLCNRQQTDFYLLMMPGDKPFKTKDLSAQIGSSRLSFAKPDFMEKFLDIKPGAVSVMGLMNDKDMNVTSHDKLPDAIVCANDEMAIGVCTALDFLKVRVPDDVIVTGCDY